MNVLKFTIEFNLVRFSILLKFELERPKQKLQEKNIFNFWQNNS